MAEEKFRCLFSLGMLCSTPLALELVSMDQIRDALVRHIQGDWGEVCKDDRQSNDEAVKEGTRLLSAYTSKEGNKFWIITEADRSVTTVLMPEEY